ncbi:MAG: methylornithine synthase PylB, partial [Candidatus Methanomethylophilaceae archaeon]|nr:methylornithine synthase PylB [Candidatus Methanomethylophilaceae archaeon]
MIEDIISRSSKGYPLGTRDVYELMQIKDPDSLDMLFSAAGKVRDRMFGKKIFTYGFVYFSTFCKNDCTFCYYRRSNGSIGRYRKTKEEIISLSANLLDAGVDLSDLTMGEDPEMYAGGYEGLLDIISGVHDEVGISIMASPGAMPQHM